MSPILIYQKVNSNTQTDKQHCDHALPEDISLSVWTKLIFFFIDCNKIGISFIAMIRFYAPSNFHILEFML